MVKLQDFFVKSELIYTCKKIKIKIIGLVKTMYKILIEHFEFIICLINELCLTNLVIIPTKMKKREDKIVRGYMTHWLRIQMHSDYVRVMLTIL